MAENDSVHRKDRDQRTPRLGILGEKRGETHRKEAASTGSSISLKQQTKAGGHGGQHQGEEGIRLSVAITYGRKKW